MFVHDPVCYPSANLLSDQFSSLIHSRFPAILEHVKLNSLKPGIQSGVSTSEINYQSFPHAHPNPSEMMNTRNVECLLARCLKCKCISLPGSIFSEDYHKNRGITNVMPYLTNLLKRTAVECIKFDPLGNSPGNGLSDTVNRTLQLDFMQWCVCCDKVHY